MSLSWRERLLIGIAPDQLALVRVAGALRPRVSAKRLVGCPAPAGETPWQGAALALQSAAEGLRREALRVTVVLSNHFARYALVPWEGALAGVEEELAFARHCFAKIHGERAKAWALRVSAERAGRPRLACAVDAALLEAIRACFPAGGKARLVSVQPYLMAAVNRWRGALPRAGAWLLVVEPERACIVLHAAGRWQAVRNARGAFDTPQDWLALLERERARLDGATPPTVLVHAAHGADAALPHAAGWKFHRLALPGIAGHRANEDGRYATALAAR